MTTARTALEVALAEGDFVVARRWNDEAIAMASGWHLVAALLARARVAVRNATEKKRSDTPMMGWLAHVYTKLGIKSRVQLVQEASRRT